MCLTTCKSAGSETNSQEDPILIGSLKKKNTDEEMSKFLFFLTKFLKRLPDMKHEGVYEILSHKAKKIKFFGFNCHLGAQSPLFSLLLLKIILMYLLIYSQTESSVSFESHSKCKMESYYD